MDTQKLIWQAFSGIVLSRSIETIAACNIWFRGKLLDVSFLCPIEILEHVWMRNTSIVVGGHEICGGLFYPVVVLIPIGWAAPVRPRKNVIFGSFQRQACLFFHVRRLESSTFFADWLENQNWLAKFLDAGIQDVSTSISIVPDLIEMSSGNDDADDDGDESDNHI